jgi:hypothetical protein
MTQDLSVVVDDRPASLTRLGEMTGGAGVAEAGVNIDLDLRRGSASPWGR